MLTLPASTNMLYRNWNFLWFLSLGACHPVIHCPLLLYLTFICKLFSWSHALQLYLHFEFRKPSQTTEYFIPMRWKISITITLNYILKEFLWFWGVLTCDFQNVQWSVLHKHTQNTFFSHLLKLFVLDFNQHKWQNNSDVPLTCSKWPEPSCIWSVWPFNCGQTADKLNDPHSWLREAMPP